MSGPPALPEGLPHVVIVGGGFGGVACARGLRGAPVRITLVDRRNHHLFQPLLYQVASAALAPGDIAEPIRALLADQENARVLLGEVVSVDLAARRLRLVDRELPYDHLVLAAGATHSYFGRPDWEAVAPGLKTLDDALEIRQQVLLAFERAEWTADPAERRRLLSFVVVGGGPTGVELAGALSEIARRTLAQDFRHIDPTAARVVLVEAGGGLLQGFADPLRRSAAAQLQRIGVEVRLGRPVVEVDDGGVVLGGDAPERIEARTVLWAAGVAGAPLGRSLGVALDRAGRVEVDPDLRLPGHPEVRVIGDQAAFPASHGGPLPGVAPAAIQMGQHAARDLRRQLAGQPTTPFRYWDKGSMATIGRSRAVAQIGRLQVSGYPAWLMWLFIHLMFLVGFRNRLLVLVQWSWSYLTWERSSRLIRGERAGGLPELVDRGGRELGPRG
jgi:NADH:ubiquinone reductase (H+-translocating)